MQEINNTQSDFINAVRGVSAQIVLIGHLYGFYFSNQSIYIQNFGVVIFFILSGHLITISALKAIQENTFNFKKFFIDRFSRIYAGLLPAIIVCIAIDISNIYLISEKNTLLLFENLNINAFFASLFNVGGLPNPFKFGDVIDPIGSMRPLWSVALEWWIYVFVGILFIFLKNKKYIGLGLIISGLAITAFQAIFDLNHIRYFIINAWFIASGIVLLKLKIFNNRIFLFAPMVYLIFLTSNMDVIYFYEPSVIIALISIYFSTFEIIKKYSFKNTFKNFSNTLSSFSYSLYLVHYSIIVLLMPLLKFNNKVEFFILFVICNIFAYLFFNLFESKYIYLRNYLMNKLTK